MKHLIKMIFVFCLSIYFCNGVFAKIQCTSSDFHGNTCTCQNIKGTVDKLIAHCTFDNGWPSCNDDSIASPAIGGPCKCNGATGKIQSILAKCSHT